MTQCWRENPRVRPSFNECRECIGIELRLRSQQTFEKVQNLLNSYHSYVNFQNSMMQNSDSVDSPLLISNSKLIPEADAAENPEYNFVTKSDAAAVENVIYSIENKPAN